MLLPQPMQRGTLVSRYKRFFADVALDDGRQITAHCPNPGAMLGLNTPGLRAWVSPADGAKRKLPWTLEMVEADGGLVGINTLHPNRLVAEALADDRIPELSGYASIRREVKYAEASRVDFLLESPGRPPCWLEINNRQSLSPPAERVWLEVKNCHFRRGGTLAEFPDCIAARSARHMGDLADQVRLGDRAVVMFVVQRTDCDGFSACRDIDPKFADALENAADAGVEVLIYGTKIAADAITLAGPLPWRR